jgi:anaerobic ribonucleoside-triphosphate reductase
MNNAQIDISINLLIDALNSDILIIPAYNVSLNTFAKIINKNRQIEDDSDYDIEDFNDFCESETGKSVDSMTIQPFSIPNDIYENNEMSDDKIIF